MTILGTTNAKKPHTNWKRRDHTWRSPQIGRILQWVWTSHVTIIQSFTIVTMPQLRTLYRQRCRAIFNSRQGPFGEDLVTALNNNGQMFYFIVFLPGHCELWCWDFYATNLIKYLFSAENVAAMWLTPWTRRRLRLCLNLNLLRFHHLILQLFICSNECVLTRRKYWCPCRIIKCRMQHLFWFCYKSFYCAVQLDKLRAHKFNLIFFNS